MIVRDLINTIDMQKLLRVRMQRNRADASDEAEIAEKLRLLLNTLLELPPTPNTGFVVLAIKDDFGICRVFPVDLIFIEKATYGHLDPAQTPRSPYLGNMKWEDVLGMEVCKSSLRAAGQEEYVDDLIRWVTHDFPPHETEYLLALTAKKLQDKVAEAMQNFLAEYGYLDPIYS